MYKVELEAGSTTGWGPGAAPLWWGRGAAPQEVSKCYIWEHSGKIEFLMVIMVKLTNSLVLKTLDFLFKFGISLICFKSNP